MGSSAAVEEVFTQFVLGRQSVAKVVENVKVFLVAVSMTKRNLIVVCTRNHITNFEYIRESRTLPAGRRENVPTGRPKAGRRTPYRLL